MKRREAMGLMGALPFGGAAAAGAAPAGARKTSRGQALLDPGTSEGLYTIHRKLHFSFDDRLVYWYLILTRYGLVDSAFTPFWNMYVGFLSVSEDIPGGFRTRVMSAIFYTDLETDRLLEHFDNPYTGKRVAVPQPGVIRVVRDYSRTGLVTPLPRTYGTRNLDMETRQYGDVGPAWILGDDVWCYGDTGFRAEPSARAPRVVQVNDWSAFHGSAAEVSDPKVMSANATQNFNDINTWSDWLEMGDHPGNFVSRGFGRKVGSLADMPPGWTSIMKERNPRELADVRGYILDRK
jgi:hypothetical protein